MWTMEPTRMGRAEGSGAGLSVPPVALLLKWVPPLMTPAWLTCIVNPGQERHSGREEQMLLEAPRGTDSGQGLTGRTLGCAAGCLALNSTSLKTQTQRRGS